MGSGNAGRSGRSRPDRTSRSQAAPRAPVPDGAPRRPSGDRARDRACERPAHDRSWQLRMAAPGHQLGRDARIPRGGAGSRFSQHTWGRIDSKHRGTVLGDGGLMDHGQTICQSLDPNARRRRLEAFSGSAALLIQRTHGPPPPWVGWAGRGSGSKSRRRCRRGQAHQIGAHPPQPCRGGFVVAALRGSPGFAVDKIAARHRLEISSRSQVD